MVEVIGLCGSIGAGKDVVSKFLKSEYGYIQITVGDVVRAFVKNKGLEPTRDNCDRISEEMRQKNGPTFWLEQCVEVIKNQELDKVVVDGVRLPSDDEILRNSFCDYILFKVDASPEVRFERLKTRARPGFPETLEKFEEHEKRQNEMFKLDVTFKRAAAVIDNSTTLDALYANIRELAKKEEFKRWFS
jgi:dephospho-CoA kinase